MQSKIRTGYGGFFGLIVGAALLGFVPGCDEMDDVDDRSAEEDDGEDGEGGDEEGCDKPGQDRKSVV